MAESTSLEEVLNMAQLGTLIPKFKEEKIELDTLCHVSDSELIRLGVSTLGDRIRLRQLCKSAVSSASCAANATSSITSGASLDSNSFGRLHNLQERRSLFTPYSSGSSSRHTNTINNTRSRRTNKNKGPTPRSWTVSFFCLANKYAFRVPSNSEKIILQNAGLGFKKIRLDLSDDEVAVMNKLTNDELVTEEEQTTCGFPALKTCGGFELLTCQANSRDLVVINSSMVAQDLKNHMGGSQSKIYIRPIQQCLSTKSILKERKSVLKEKCRKCNNDFLLKDLRKHVIRCGRVENSCTMSTSEESGQEWDVSVRDDLPRNDQGETTTVPSASSCNLAFNVMVETNSGLVEILPPSTLAQSSDASSNQTLDSLIDQPLELKISNLILEIKEKQLHQNPITILKELQQHIVKGRPLEITDLTEDNSGMTNFILVDRENLLSTAFDEIKSIADLTITLEVQFYGEVAQDYGGPRKEFFLMMLRKIKEKYFDGGIKRCFEDDYFLIGILFGLTILQNGKLPTFLGEDLVKKVFEYSEDDAVINNIRKGLDKLGLIKVGRNLPLFLYLFRNNESSRITSRNFINLLKPEFAEEGSNERRFQNQMYSLYLKYIREVASGRRENLSLEKMLIFVTGTDEIPALGFEKQPSVIFQRITESFIPMASTCINQLKIPIPTNDIPLCDEKTLFVLYDYAFSNSYFGLA